MKVITICGSLSFKEEMYPVKNFSKTDTQLEKLKEAHFKRIELSDAIYVINKNNYIGDSTKIEIDYAKKFKKEIMYLEKI